MTRLRTTDLGTILGVWAHPDDEAYLSAGLMARAREWGQRVVVVTATRGERGTSDPLRWPPRRLARVRQAELGASLAALGVSEHRFLDYVDGTLAAQDNVVGVRRIAAIMAEVVPDTIVTFGPDGLTGHSDHRRISTWTMLARMLSARRGCCTPRPPRRSSTAGRTSRTGSTSTSNPVCHVARRPRRSRSS